MSYFNTTKETGDRLMGYQTQAVTQDQKILNYFELNPDEIMTPWEIQSLVFSGGTPITSVRRSINTLTRVGTLAKTRIMKETGSYGRRSHGWMLDPLYRERMDQDVVPPPERKSKDEPKTSSQGKLFHIAPIDPVNCSLCGQTNDQVKAEAMKKFKLMGIEIEYYPKGEGKRPQWIRLKGKNVQSKTIRI